MQWSSCQEKKQREEEEKEAAAMYASRMIALGSLTSTKCRFILVRLMCLLWIDAHFYLFEVSRSCWTPYWFLHFLLFPGPPVTSPTHAHETRTKRLPERSSSLMILKRLWRLYVPWMLDRWAGVRSNNVQVLSSFEVLSRFGGRIRFLPVDVLAVYVPKFFWNP